MNVLMLSDVYFPRVNGVSTSIRTFALALARMGHRVNLVVPDYGAGSGQEAHGGGDAFEIIRLPARRIFFDPEDCLIRASAVRNVLPKLAARHWDVIHIHTPFRAHTLGLRLSALSARRWRRTTRSSRNTSPTTCRGRPSRGCGCSRDASRTACAMRSIT
jgi:glycosyltransferase involved in cell wall biosynthesis